jgi:hypothetical protein
MNTMMKLRLLPFFFVFAGIAVAEDVKPNAPQPKVDERVELLGIVYRLAGAEEFQCDRFKEYDDAINKHFAKFKNHPVIWGAKMSRNIGIGHDRVVSYALHISIEDGRIIFPDENSEISLEKLGDEWNLKAAQLFAKQLDDFYVKSRFHEFFESHREMYQKTEQRIKTISDKIDYSWFKRFYGDAKLEHLHIVPICISDSGGYGPSIRFKDGREEYFSVVSAPGPDAAYHENAFIRLVIHEFNHSFCNPLVDKHFDALKPAVERVFPFIADSMARMYYGEPRYVMYEFLVRACTIRYWLDQDEVLESAKWIQENRNMNFLWIEELVKSLGRYEKGRDKYPTLDDFIPEIAKMQNALVTDEYIAPLQKWKQKEENRPKIVSTNPPNGAKDVDPGITEISVTFDRPMMSGMAWCTPDGNKTYPERSVEKFPVWSEDKRTCTMKNVVLKPGRTYNIWFNSDTELYSDIPGDGFRSAKDIPLVPVRYTFMTKAE